MSNRPRTVWTGAIAFVVVAAAAIVIGFSGLHPTSCYAQGKKCGCPVSAGEKVLIACNSSVSANSCGACSVVTNDGKRTGRPCISVP